MVPRLAVVLLVILAGCLGIGGEQPTQRDTREATTQAGTKSVDNPTTTDSTTSQGMFDCEYGLSVSEASEGAEDRIDRSMNFSSLSEERQEEFMEARTNGSANLGDHLAYPWTSLSIVHYNNTSYKATAMTC